MHKRPAFETLTSYEEFSKYYWYWEELAAICRGLKLEATGTKQELNAVIEAYFRGERRVPPNEGALPWRRCRLRRRFWPAVSRLTRVFVRSLRSRRV